ncbi:protein kinase [candidate division KSB1 bacterium]|nr:protein kinase [candidate division KSB1 bacterium]
MIGKTISHYKILAKLGEGGMGVVYKAEDTKLKRIVALKFLSAIALGGEEKSRFLREAQAAAALNHPNICTIHAIDEVDGQMFIAMEFIEGQSLREKIEAGPLKIDEAIKFAMQIVEGLQAAHEKGITHRDIKSANVMITDKGQVKIMDFGLAKLARGGTMLTKEGMTLGTAAYMSPEQARGEVVDHRTDIWSLGVVLYEMISGRLPFRGEYEAAMMYSILNEEPEPLTSLRSNVPMDLERVVAKMLAKNPAARYQHVDELPVDLKSIDLSAAGTSKTSAAKVARQSEKQSAFWLRAIPWGIAVLMTLVALIAILVLQRPTPAPVKRSNITLPESAPIAPIGSAPLGVGHPALALSPDGTNLVYVADLAGKTQLYRRSMDQFEAVPLPGTEGAYNPFFSPDGQWIGFFTGNSMKKFSILVGEPILLCDVINPSGASWGSDGRIIFSHDDGQTLSWVLESGGTPQVLSEKQFWNAWPEILPGGKAVLVSSGQGINLISLETSEKKTLLKRGYNPKYISTGHLVYALGGRLEAVPFDLNNLKVIGSPVPVLNNVRMEATLGATQYAISNDGTLVYLPGVFQGKNTLLWLDRKGHAQPLQFPAETDGTFQLSPDGKRLAIAIQNAKRDVWIFDLLRGSRSRLTIDGNNWFPVWTPDGKWVAFGSDRTGAYNIFMQSADESGEIKQLTTSETYHSPSSWSPDGKLLAFEETGQSYDIYLLSIDGESKKQPFATTRFNEWGLAFSPDGRLIAYTSDEQGQYEIYVQPYPQTGERWRISTEGGDAPVWSRSSRELFYRNGRKWMAVRYSTDPKFSFELPKLIFEGDYLNVWGRSYDVSPDGQRFLLLKSSEEPSRQTQLNVVTNWFEELKRKAPRGK